MKKLALGVACAALVSCGGGGGGGTGGGGNGGTSQNRAPTFTSSNSISYTESRGQTDDRAVVTVAATDPDGDALTYQILNGKDSALFSFTNGPTRLAFQQAVSFETPRDSNADNVYELDISVSDGRGAVVVQTIRVTVTNSPEGLAVTQLATVASAANGALVYLDDSNQLLLVGRSGGISLLSAASGSVASSAQITMLPNEQVLDIGADSLAFRQNHFFVLTRRADVISILYVDATNGDRRTLWSQTFSGGVTASLGFRGSDPLIAFSDGGNRDAAQDPSDLRGNVVRMITLGQFDTPSSITLSPATVGWGLKDPRLSISTNIQAWPMDRGENFNEINQADFPISQGNANFEWPIRDGLTDVGFTGTVQGDRVAPRVVLGYGDRNAGLWLDAADSLQGEGWFGVWVIGDSLGNIWTWDAGNDGPIELRNADFGRNNPGASTAVISIDDGDFDVGRAIPIYMLQANGVVLVADLTS